MATATAATYQNLDWRGENIAKLRKIMTKALMANMIGPRNGI